MSARGLVATASLVLVLGTGTLAQELPAELRLSFDDGVRALKAGKLDEAEAAFRAVLEAGAGLAQVHNNLGIVYQQGGRHERAITEFRAAVRLDPDYAAPQILLGASLLALGRVEDARPPLEQAVKMVPRQALARLQLVRVLEQLGDWNGAVDQYRVLRQLKPEEPEYIYGLGRAYLRLSEARLRELRALDPASARSQQAEGHTFRVQGRPNLALQAFERAAQADPTMPEIHLAMAQIHLAQKRWAEARREIGIELALVPESAGARALLQQLRALESASQ
jgi:tetratricopeptide (TPR) repeat protein